MGKLSSQEQISILRYIDNDMSPTERSAFERELEKNEALRDALSFENELMEKGKTSTEKIRTFSNDEKKRDDKDLWEMIQQARAHSEHANPGSSQLPGTTLHSGEGKSETKANKYNRVIKMPVWKSAAVAAALLVIVALSAIWYFRSTPDKSSVATKSNKSDSSKAQVSQNKPSPKETIITDSGSKINNEIVNTPTRTIQLNKRDRERLVKKNFIVDAPPSNAPDPLNEAFAYLEKGSYQEARSEYINALAVAENPGRTRGVEDEKAKQERNLIIFYAHYYNALSNMADDKPVIAISELKAIKKAPNEFYESKVKWNLALLYLKIGKVGTANTLLQQISGNNKAKEYKQKAINLIEEINKITLVNKNESH